MLEALLKSLNEKTEFVLCLDDRMPIPMDMVPNVKIMRIKPSFARRLAAERWLAKSVASEDIVLCFGNLPPLFKLRGYVVVFVQNRYLIDDVKLTGFTIWVRLRLIMERLWLLKKMVNVSEFIVQTPTMKSLLEIKTQNRVPVRILPFVAEPSGHVRILAKLKTYKQAVFDFVYVASGETHKNHQKLIEAWCLLAVEGFFPSLCLTLNEVHFPRLCRLIDEMRQRYQVNVKNVGVLSHDDVLALYKKSVAMIYPSTFESFGLPLIEARQAGLPVLASELDYVRDVLDPEQSFDPDSSMSIARAVKRFMGMEERPLSLLNASQFLASVIGKDLQ